MTGVTHDRSDPGLAQIEPSGMQKTYLVLSEAERAKGFVRPVRDSYVHVGIAGPQYPVRDLTPEEAAMFAQVKYVKYETYPQPNPEGSSALGRFWTRDEMDKIGKGCGTRTTMGQALSETYARQPNFYGATFCCGCGTHLPVGKHGEFVWDGTDLRVGT